MKLLVCLLWLLSAAPGLVSAASFTNPLKARDGSDPFMVYDATDGYYYLMTTTWNDLKLTRAKTLAGLKTGETRVVWTDANSARCCNVWAPEIHRIDNTYACTPSLLLSDRRADLSVCLSAGGTSTTPPATAPTSTASAAMC